MQFGALWTERTAGGHGGNGGSVPLGLYLGAHDPIGRLQLLTMSGQYSGSEGRALPSSRVGASGIRYYHLPDSLINDSALADYQLPYPVVLSSFVGDWYDAAMLHRDWAVRNASWTLGGNLSTRSRTEKNYPAWLLDTPFWAGCVGYNCYLNLSLGVQPDLVTNTIALRELLGIPQLALEYAKWNEEAWDANFPNFTARPQFAEAVSRLEAGGVRVVPYTTGRLFDPLIPDWSRDGAARYECVGINGAPYYEKFEPAWNWSQRVMNPATAYWQQKISNLSSYIFERANVSGIYSDAATAPPQACANPIPRTTPLNDSSGTAATQVCLTACLPIPLPVPLFHCCFNA